MISMCKVARGDQDIEEERNMNLLLDPAGLCSERVMP